MSITTLVEEVRPAPPLPTHKTWLPKPINFRAKIVRRRGEAFPGAVSIYPSPALLVLGKLTATVFKVAHQKIQQRSAQISQAASHLHHKISGDLDKNLKALTNLGLSNDQAREQEKMLLAQAGGDQRAVERMITDLGGMQKDLTDGLAHYGLDQDYASKMFFQHLNTPFSAMPESITGRLKQFEKTSNSLHKALEKLAAQHPEARADILDPNTHHRALMASEGYAFNVPRAGCPTENAARALTATSSRAYICSTVSMPRHPRPSFRVQAVRAANCRRLLFTSAATPSLLIGQSS